MTQLHVVLVVSNPGGPKDVLLETMKRMPVVFGPLPHQFCPKILKKQSKLLNLYSLCQAAKHLVEPSGMTEADPDMSNL